MWTTKSTGSKSQVENSVSFARKIWQLDKEEEKVERANEA